jgi:hypothetical protein
VRQWVLSPPIPLRVLLAAQPEPMTPMLQAMQRVISRAVGAEAQYTVTRRHDAPGNKPAGVHAAAGGTGSAALAAPHQVSRCAGAERQARALAVPQGPQVQDQATEAAVAGECRLELVQTRFHRIRCARLLERVFDVDL